jgi:hypothetical protein
MNRECSPDEMLKVTSKKYASSIGGKLGELTQSE